MRKYFFQSLTFTWANLLSHSLPTLFVFPDSPSKKLLLTFCYSWQAHKHKEKSPVLTTDHGQSLLIFLVMLEQELKPLDKEYIIGNINLSRERAGGLLEHSKMNGTFTFICWKTSFWLTCLDDSLISFILSLSAVCPNNCSAHRHRLNLWITHFSLHLLLSANLLVSSRK